MPDAISLSTLNARIAGTVNAQPSLTGVWVVAETSDLRRSAHCYLELVEKHPLTGEPVARLRANIWRNMLLHIDSVFTSATGQRLASGMKIMVKITVSFHPAFGLSANITDIDPSYSMGDLMRRRREIIARLTAEGIIDLNRELEWPRVALRIAVISAQGAAGYGDFIHQLYSTPANIAFRVQLFPALMQGQGAPDSIIAALEEIAAQEEEWDCVVIIRGGGATSDLAAFESYPLAANIAQFPLPVIIGIGHERDITVLDEVANMRVKTPTAAAEWLIARAEQELALLHSIAVEIYNTASSMIAGYKEQLARIEAALPHLPEGALASARNRLDRLTMSLGERALSRLAPERSSLTLIGERISTAASAIIERQRMRVDRLDEMVKILSPASTLARGYSITRVNGHAITSAQGIPPGTTLVTTLAHGTLTSITREE